MNRIVPSVGRIFALLFLLLAGIRGAHGSVALLLEEPYGHFGAFTATGHAAVYLPRVCAESPILLRRCQPGESGVVISRYDAISGYDWVAIPLIPYLYAVETPEDVPLFANGKIAAFLRNQYRRKFLETVAPDSINGEPTTGHWTQLVGAAYDRTIFSYEIKTSEAQDDALIYFLNTRPNRSRFNLLTHNCADFARAIVNFYYPRHLHRSLVADLGITTPKQLARTLAKFSNHHPEIEASRFVIPQVPGNLPRSTPAHGILESLLKSKKYFVPLAIFHPFLTGGMAIAYLGSGRFDPAKAALVLDSSNKLRPPLTSDTRQAYEGQLKSLMMRLNIAAQNRTAESASSLSQALDAKKLSRLESDAEPRLDSDGKPELEIQVGRHLVDLGLSRDNILKSPVYPELVQEILVARLRDELRRGSASKTAESDLINDWNLLQQAVPVRASWRTAESSWEYRSGAAR